MDSEILGLIVKELNKNGVNLIKHDFSNIDTFSPENVDYFRPGELPQIFDFSEHDKVFEDEIEDLESLMQKRDEFLEMKNIQIAELKKRIAELESRESQNPKNGWICVVAEEINGQEYVKLKDFMRVVNDLQEQNRLEDDGK